MKTIALIGCGALSHIFARNLLRILPGEFRITGVMARHAGSAESFADTLDCRFFTEIDPLLALKPDFVIEFAGGAAVREYGEAVLRSGANFIPASVGALADPEFFNTLKTAAKKSGAKLFIPSGAIGGLDLMQVYALKGDARVEIEDVKAPRSLEGAPDLKAVSHQQPRKKFSSLAVSGTPLRLSRKTSMSRLPPQSPPRLRTPG